MIRDGQSGPGGTGTQFLFLTGTKFFFYRDRDQNFFCLGPAPKFFLNRTGTNMFFLDRDRDQNIFDWDRHQNFFSRRDRDQK